MKIIEVHSSRDLEMFIAFPDELYKGCPQYVPALHSEQRRCLTGAASLEYCTRRMWMVVDGHRVLGRICAMVNPRYNEKYGLKRARFGWFDCVNDSAVAKLLMDTAQDWAKSLGMTEIHGPLYYNTLGRQGMLVEGYENVPPFNCLYNFPYYNDLVNELGFVKELDWVQYRMVANHGVPEKTRRVAKVVSERYKLHFGSLDEIKKDREKVKAFFRVYSESFAESVTNFIPFTEAEIEEEAGLCVNLISDKVSSILLDEQENIVAFGISSPSISKALQKARGRLFPFGWFHLFRAMRDYETTDLLINGAVPEWQNRGVSALFYMDMADKAMKAGNRWAVSNPQIENNSAVNIWNDYEHEPFMRRRCYVKTIE